MKNLNISLLFLSTLFLNININNAQTTYGISAGTQGGGSNSYFGQYAGQNNTENHNSFFGFQSGRYTSSGTSNSFFGSYSGQNNINGSQNAFFGASSGRYNSSGNENAFFGYLSGQNNIDGSQNVFFGKSSGRYNTEGSYNTFVGIRSGNGNTTGEYNSFIGANSGRDNINGSQNSFFGSQAGYLNNNGNMNSFFGYRSGRQNETGEKNTFLGVNSGYENIIGMDNTYIGYSTGKNATGNSNVFIGYEAGYDETGDNKLYIANNRNEPLIYGDFSTSELTFNGKIGIASGAGTCIIESVQHEHNGVTENFLSLRANNNPGNSILFSETGRISIGSDGACMRHTTTVDSTFLIVDGVALKYGDSFWQSASDQNLKKNISPLKKSINKFLDINFYSYQYKKTNQTRYGIIAQEMKELFPHSMGKLIEEDGTEYLTFNPNNLFYTSLKATQEIGELALAQETKIEKLEKENTNLKAELRVIKTALKNYNIDKENTNLKAELRAIKTALKNNGIDIAQNNNNYNSLKQEVPQLLQNIPNPFGETTTIPYFLSQNTQNAYIVVYDDTGKTIEKHSLPVTEGAANLELSLMKTNFIPGIYSYSLVVDGILIDSKKMIRH